MSFQIEWDSSKARINLKRHEGIVEHGQGFLEGDTSAIRAANTSWWYSLQN
jgi:uncharacterized DUF497 family protein